MDSGHLNTMVFVLLAFIFTRPHKVGLTRITS